MSTLRANALEGMDAKNSITIVAGAGNVTTTNVQEGLCKAWCRFNGSDSTVALDDSLNFSSISDHGTGNYQPVYTNVMSHAEYTASLLFGHVGGSGILRIGNNDMNTNNIGLVGTDGDQSTVQDINRAGCQVFGDLA